MLIATRKTVHCALCMVLGALSFTTVAQPNQNESSAAVPDVVGIRPGIPIGEAYRLLKAHDPKGSILYGQKRIVAISEKPITHAFVYSPMASSQDPEIIIVDMTFPPSQQTVWRVTRYVHFEVGKEPVPATLLTALRQKYGQGVPSPMAQYAFWVFDEQGRAVRSASGIDLSDCAMYLEKPSAINSFGVNGDGVISANVSPGVSLSPTVVAANREACYPYIYVMAYLAPYGPNRESVDSVTVTITDLGAGIRAGNATVALMNQAAAAEAQRERNKALQQVAPKF